ncbi:GGDEF domain-containing protein [Lysobacter koreensis]|uniref:diguanylate cyclase n=1 Tax=Lysobacter koreensis TaxID=266122 RepID=A0ABW2YKM7_9GAMM
MSAVRVPHPSTEIESRRQAALDSYAVVDTPPEQAFDDIVRLAATLCDVPAAAISLIDHERLWFKAQIGLDQPQLPRFNSLCDHAILDPGSTVVVDDLAANPGFAAHRQRIGGQPPRFYAGVPLLSPDGYALGTVCVMDVVPRRLGAPQLHALELLARQASHLLELRRYARKQRELLSEREAFARRIERSRAELQHRHEQLQQTANRDELTGLLNRSALVQLRNNPEAMQKLQQAYSLVVLDVDLFKQVNDRHGHLLGDRALREVAAAVTASVREGDLAVRYGGEEFLIVLPGTNLASAVEIAHRIRLRVAEASLPFPLTVSAGVAAGDASRDSPEQVFERADQALYRAKAAGRNRVVVDDTPYFNR